MTDIIRGNCKHEIWDFKIHRGRRSCQCYPWMIPIFTLLTVISRGLPFSNFSRKNWDSFNFHVCQLKIKVRCKRFFQVFVWQFVELTTIINRSCPGVSTSVNVLTTRCASVVPLGDIRSFSTFSTSQSICGSIAIVTVPMTSITSCRMGQHKTQMTTGESFKILTMVPSLQVVGYIVTLKSWTDINRSTK